MVTVETMVRKTMVTKTMVDGDGQRVEGRGGWQSAQLRSMTYQLSLEKTEVTGLNCTKSGHPTPDRSIPQPKPGAKYEH
jgi:hypothetical protein